MEIKNTIYLIVVALFLLFMQVMILNNLLLFGVAIPIVYLYLIIILPFNLNKSLLLTIGFGYGLLADFLDGSLGYYAISAVVISFFRPYILALLLPKEKREVGYPSLRNQTISSYSNYLLIMIFLHNTVLFFVESMSLASIGLLSLKIISSSILSFLIIILFELLQSKKS